MLFTIFFIKSDFTESLLSVSEYQTDHYDSSQQKTRN